MSPDDLLRASTLRLQTQQAALFALLKSGIASAAPEVAFRTLTESSARTLGVPRASIWLLSADQSRLILSDLYDLKANRHSAGVELEAARYPAYFHALRWSRAIVAPDARTDARTAEFGAGYLDAYNITSMLDAGIWQAGKAIGVICLEAVGERREWSHDEQQFAASVADLAAATLDRETLRLARVQLEESRELYERAVDWSPDWISIVRLSDNQFVHVNRQFERGSGYPAAEVIGRTPIEIGLWVDPQWRSEWLTRVARDGEVRDFEARFRTREGAERIFTLSADRVEIHGEKCVICTARDITEQKRSEDVVFEIAQGVGSETGAPFFRSLVERLERALKSDMAFVGEIDRANPLQVRTIAAQAAGGEARNFTYDLHGSPCETILGRGICAYPERVWERFPEDRALKEKGIEGYVGAPLIDSAGKPMGLIAVLFRRPLDNPAFIESLLRIFAARASAEMDRGRHLDELQDLAMHDSLTGLPNRVLLRELVESGIEAGKRGGTDGALLLIDLDRFKEINDTLGHHMGDVLLRKVADRLRQEMADCCDGEVARLGGDEFAIWIPRLGETSAVDAARHALSVLTAPFEVEGYRLEVGASIGIAHAPRHASTPSDLLRCADVAMYSAKREGSGFATYEVSQDPYSVQRLALLSELGVAVRGGQLVVHYQPRARLAREQLSGFEALVRWNHPRLGLLPPAQFIPLAELTDIIRPLTLWVLDEALGQLRRWSDAGLQTRVSVNISGRHLVDEGCPEQIARLLQAHGVKAEHLELEITESALIADPERASNTLQRIRALGVRIAIDDFGTGYSSLTHLRRLPLHALKIDMSFVRHMLERRDDRAIVESTISLAHNLELEVVAEGIENEATLAALRACGCDEGQGYHIGRPMDAAAAAQWMRATERWTLRGGLQAHLAMSPP